MKTSSNPTVLLSVALAVSLWFVATWFEDDARWLPAEATQTNELALEAPRSDSALRVNTDALSCQQVEEELVADVASSQYCSTDEDCTLFDYGYPIQCMTSVSKQEITALRLAYRDYEQSCSYRVYYDCPSGNMERQAVCRNSRCEVELVTIDPLNVPAGVALEDLGLNDKPRLLVMNKMDLLGDDNATTARSMLPGIDEHPSVFISAAKKWNLESLLEEIEARLVDMDESLEEAAPGSTGLLAVFDLANVGSAVHLLTEDLGVADGDGFQLVGRAAGAELRGCSLTVEELGG